MLPWVLVFIVLVLAGLGVLAGPVWRLFGDVRHLGATVADASARLSRAAADLQAAGDPTPPPAPEPVSVSVPRPRSATAHRP
ncbi:hypothetical protein [Embleya sp. AB8]|uniref:hypothetical protein n=1 Tax=Embleya sp. AB8 TaxID=3156304 RepID=UPI003C770819